MTQNTAPACAEKNDAPNPCEACNEACPMARSIMNEKVDWKIWAFLAAGVLVAGAVLKLVF